MKYLFCLFLIGVIINITAFKKDAVSTFQVNIVYDSLAFKNNSDTINFSKNKPLSWSDFKQIPNDKDNKNVANSSVGFKFKAAYSNHNNNVVINIAINSFFVRSASWVKNGHINSYILNHEQNHFNIARYGAELFRQSLLTQKINAKNFNSVLQTSYKDAWSKYLQLQKEYDSTTNHSIIKPQQEIWNKKIALLLTKCKS